MPPSLPISDARARARKPSWLRMRPPGGERYASIKRMLGDRELHTVCEEARCPNLAECWQGGTATFMLLGDVCTRGCRFCAVKSGNPQGALDADEPDKVARSVAEMDLQYVVLTSVDRDDLPDGGADHFARTVEAIKALSPGILVETLVPDFLGAREAIARLVRGGPDVYAQNQETVRRLTRRVRDARSDYDVTLGVLAAAKQLAAEQGRQLVTKSSLMLGLGETDDELEQAMRDLREVDCDVLTLGQYLQPSAKHLRVERWVPPAEFERWAERGRELGFRYVAAGPLVRSSYRAGEFHIENILRGQP